MEYSKNLGRASQKKNLMKLKFKIRQKFLNLFYDV